MYKHITKNQMTNNIKFTESGSLCVESKEYNVTVSLIEIEIDMIMIQMEHTETRQKFKKIFPKSSIISTSEIDLTVEEIYRLLCGGLKSKDKNIKLNTIFPQHDNIILKLNWTIPNEIGLSLSVDFTFKIYRVPQSNEDTREDLVKELTDKCNSKDKELEDMKKELAKKCNKQDKKELKIQYNQDGKLETLNLDELTTDELKQKITTDDQYEVVFIKLNDFFVKYSNAMQILDARREKVINFMKALHREFKQKETIENNKDYCNTKKSEKKDENHKDLESDNEEYEEDEDYETLQEELDDVKRDMKDMKDEWEAYKDVLMSIKTDSPHRLLLETALRKVKDEKK